MEIFLVLIGFLAGVLSGFFGVGGGTITVPLLIAFGIGIKEAIAISAMQMSFSSIFGSYLNHKRAVFDAKAALPFLFGGALGGIIGAYMTTLASEKLLALLLLGFMGFTVAKLLVSPAHRDASEEIYNPPLFFAIGTAIGALGSSVGIGGALLLGPILVAYLGFDLKKAIGVTLFYVISTSLFASASFYFAGLLDIAKGIWVAVASVFGVYLGIYMASKTESSRHKALLIALYILITASLIFEFFWKI